VNIDRDHHGFKAGQRQPGIEHFRDIGKHDHNAGIFFNAKME
jgi:hypothetical protein